MAREQGDEMGDEVAYTHPDHSTERRAFTAADRVNLEARGWVRKSTKTGSTARAKGASGAAGASSEGNGPA